MQEREFNSKYFWGMVALTPIGGASFPLVRYLLEILGPFHLLSYRLLGGAICLLLVRPQVLYKSNLKDLKGGLVTGLFLGAAMALLTVGLKTTGGGQGAFILSTQVLMIPLLKRLFWKEMVSKQVKVAIGLSFLGLLVMTVNFQQGFQTGDLLILLAALCVAGFGISNSKYSPTDGRTAHYMGVIQIFTAGSIVFSLSEFEKSSWIVTGNYVYAILFLILISTSFRYLFQLKLQSKVSATMTGLIFTLEPIWAAIFCMIFLYEEMLLRDWIGGFLIVIGLLIAKSSHLKVFKNIHMKLKS